jgi:hypothetical protein
MIYIIKNNTNMLSMDEVPMNDIGEYFKINKIKEIYLLKKLSEKKFGL